MKNEKDKARGRIDPLPSFGFMNPLNFYVMWGGVTFGIMQGKPYSSANWINKDAQINWIKAEMLFLRGVIERLGAYLEVIEK